MAENYEIELASELEHFNQTICQVNLQLSKKLESNNLSKDNLISSRKEMWNEAVHSTEDFDGVIEMSQYLEELKVKALAYNAENNEIQKLKNLKDSPYFARIDFTERGCEEKEKIYIGRYSLMDDDTHEMFIFDWRSPIASTFYRFELGDVTYKAPNDIIYGNVSLKRQYEIKNGKFEYFFDANVQIEDEFLRKLLSQNASSKMTSIVETIQKDQDIIIRDSKNDLLMVQGVAGSGKTSVALHRAAYLMYQGLSDKLSSNNIIILSPNTLFSKYISNVLPELGEDNVETLGFEDICNVVSDNDFKLVQTRNQFFEKLISCTKSDEKELIKSSMEFKASNIFIKMLKRLITYYEHKLIPIEDVYYNNKLIFSRHLLKSVLLKRDPLVPTAIRLKKIENMILEEVRKENKIRIVELEKFVEKYPEHIYEIKAFARMISIRENSTLLSHIRKFTRVDYMDIYYKMFHDKELFYALAEGLKLPENIEEIRQRTDKQLVRGSFQYVDTLALTFLKTKMAGCSLYKDIRQIIIDEAQDYYPIHFEILSTLFIKAKYTVLGDVNQTIEKSASLDFYENVQRILGKKTSTLLTLSKSFRCTSEIIDFSTKFIDNSMVKQECFSRKGVLPNIISSDTQKNLDEQLKLFVKDLVDEKFKSICILCKSLKEAFELCERIKASIEVVLIDDTFTAQISGVFITSIYMAKGLEFDAVIIYDADDMHYQSLDDKKLLYVASTRALHRLALFYAGKKSRFLD